MQLPFADDLILVNLAYGAIIAFIINFMLNYTNLTNEINLTFIAIFAVGYTYLRLKDVI